MGRTSQTRRRTYFMVLPLDDPLSLTENDHIGTSKFVVCSAKWNTPLTFLFLPSRFLPLFARHHV